MIRPENVLKAFLQDVWKMSWKLLEETLKTYDQDEYIGLDQDVLKTSSGDEGEKRLPDVFIKANGS